MNELILAMAIDEQERECPEGLATREALCRCGAPACAEVEPGPWLT